MSMNAEASEATEDGPVRRCIATGKSEPAASLIRFVIAPDGMIAPDLAEKLPGRGYWLSAERAVVDRAEKRGLFTKAARKLVRMPEGLADMLEGLLAKRCLDLVGLARRSGQLTVGHDRVLEEIERGRAAVVGIATDAGGERWSVERAAQGLPVVNCLDAAEMATAAGKGKVSFLAVARGGLASALAREGSRLAGFRQDRLDVNR